MVTVPPIDPNIQPDPELLKAFKETNFGSTIMDKIHTPMTCMYVDLDMMFDYHLAAIMRMIRTEAEMSYLKSRFHDYRSYKGTDICSVFPKLKFTKQQVLDFLHDETNAKYLSHCGILTNVTNMVPGYISTMDFFNRDKPDSEPPPITVHFVNRYFLPTEGCQAAITSSIKGFAKDLSCTFRHVAPENDNPTRLLSSTSILIKDIKAFLEPDTNSYKILIDEFKLKDTAVIADYRLEDDEDPYIKESMKELIDKTEKLLSTFCFFYFVDRHPLFLSDNPTNKPT